MANCLKYKDNYAVLGGLNRRGGGEYSSNILSSLGAP